MSESLLAVFGVGDAELVAVVGAGGKSTLVLGLGRELHEAGRPVVVTTTTKMGNDQVPAWTDVCRTVDDVEEVLRTGRAAFLFDHTDDHKIVGAAPDLVDEVFTVTGATVVAEADGARRQPFKAPEAHEPVIPSLATLVVIVVGANALGGTIGEVCHRPERVAELAGRSVGDVLRPEDMAMVIAHAEGGLKGIPEGARVVVALTRATPENAAELISLLGHAPQLGRVVVLDRGRA